MKDFAVLSTGESFSNPKWLRKLEKKSAKEQRTLARRDLAIKRRCKLSDAKNYQKQKWKVASIYEKIFNARTDYLQKISTHIIKSHDMIGLHEYSHKNI